MEKIKIVHFVFNLTNGGVEQVLLNYFSNIDLSNYKLSIVSQKKVNKNCLEKFEKLGFNVYELNCNKKNFIKYYKKVSNILKVENPNIVHCHMNYSNFYPILISMFNKVPVRISHSHGVIIQKKSFLYNINLIKRLQYFINKAISTNYMACGKDAAIHLFGEKNFKKNKVYILNNAIDKSKFIFNMQKRVRIRKNLNILDEEILIGNIGRFSTQKNHFFIIDIFDKCIQLNSKFKLLLIGNGILKEKVKKYAYEKEISNKIIFLENRNDIPDLLCAMDIFILPSLYEGLPLSALEAQAMNLPCFLSDTITKECQILKNTKYLSIYEGPEIWANEIKNCKIRNINREESNYDIFTEKNFNIKTEAKKLDIYYKGLINNNE